ncbi:LOW QUALITY PROTEIN: Nucleotid_trans domain-containing protein, partial [Cephalotus follicularis]
SNVSNHRDALETALTKASMEHNIVIIAVVNKANVEGDKPMIDMFLDSFWYGKDTQDLVDHLLLVVVDQTTYERCKFLKLHCYKLEIDGVDFDGEKLYMSKEFIKMMWRRTLFLGDVLKRGYFIIFQDIDVLWLRNPLTRLGLNQSIDFHISTDGFNGNKWSGTNPINTRFYMIRSNNKTITLFDDWYARKDNSNRLNEQDVLDNMLHERDFKLGIKVRFLDALYFSGFCENSKDARYVTTVHANCCRTISAKVGDLTVLHDWRKFKSSSSTNGTSLFERLNHVECSHSWQ